MVGTAWAVAADHRSSAETPFSKVGGNGDGIDPEGRVKLTGSNGRFQGGKMKLRNPSSPAATTWDSPLTETVKVPKADRINPSRVDVPKDTPLLALICENPESADLMELPPDHRMVVSGLGLY